MRLLSNALFLPSTLALLMVGLSGIAWLFPPNIGIDLGYTEPYEMGAQNFTILFFWYFLLYCSLRLGEVFGKKLSRHFKLRLLIPSVNNKHLLFIYTLLAAVGILAMFVKIYSSMSFSEVLNLILSGLANEIKDKFLEDYSAGLTSLRYLVLYSATLSINQYMLSNKIDKYLIINLVMLILEIVVLGHRMMIVAFVLSTLFIIYERKQWIHIKLFNSVLGLLYFFGIFIALSLVNFTRNSGYYEEYHGLGFFGAGVSAILAYLATPFQVSVGSADNISKIVSGGVEAYRDVVDIAIYFNTNSAFVQLHEWLGFWAWPYLMMISISFGLIFTYLRSYKNSAFLLPCVAILYASAELWRLNLFSQGVFFTSDSHFGSRLKSI